MSANNHLRGAFVPRPPLHTGLPLMFNKNL